MQTVRIVGGKTYDILIDDGLIDRCGQEIASLFRPARLALVTDDVVNDIYGKRVLKSLTQAGFDVRRHIVPTGERTKSPAALVNILEFLGENQFLKTDQLIWLGGSSLGDVAGMASALYAHGMYVVQIPTTLAAAINSSVSGKASLNLKSGRNLAGAHVLPSLVLCDTELMGALPNSLLFGGVAEMLKCALLDSEPMLHHLESGAWQTSLAQSIEWCVRVKNDIVRMDKFGAATAQMMEMGSLVGNAIVTCSKGKISHGQGLGIGLLTMARAVPRMMPGVSGCADRVERALLTCGLPVACPFTCGELLNAIAATKRRNEIYFSIAVPCNVGECELRRVTLDELSHWLRAGGIGE